MVAQKPLWHLSWKTVEVDGRAAHYGEAGTGAPFVFLHGWGLGDRSYKRALNRLARLGLRVVAPSLPGFGGTADLPKDEFTLEGYARWVIAFCEAVGIHEDFYLAGHSFGGGVSIQGAHDFPDRVSYLVLVNSIGGSVWKDGVKSLAERPLWDWGLHFPRDMLPGRQVTRVIPVIAEDVIGNLFRNPLALWRVGQIARSADLRDELEALKQRGLPVVVLWGKEDKVLPEASLEAIAEALGGEADVVDGRHSWLLADPDSFGEVMTNVIAVAEYARRRKEQEEAEKATRRRKRRARA